MKPKKINDENREAIRADLGTMTRKAICEKYGVDYQMLQREFGFTHKKQRKVNLEQAESVH